MNWFEALLIGFIQGISEFLPISSTAHLLIAKQLLTIDISHNQLSFELFLHVASLLAVIVYFRKDLTQILTDVTLYLKHRSDQAKPNFRFASLMLVSTLVTMVIGKGFEQWFEKSLTSTATIGISLIITGLFLILIEHGVREGTRTQEGLTWKDGVLIGLAQALAIIPGISRSGSTLIAALWCGLNKELALRYSFMLSIPVIAGISLLKLPEFFTTIHTGVLFELWLAFIASFFFALIGIKWIIGMVARAKLSYFAVYCIALGLVTWGYL